MDAGLTIRRTALAWSALVCAAVLVGCGSPTPTETTEPAPQETDAQSESPEPRPETTRPADAIDLPGDCRAILSADVLEQLEGVPLNHEAFGDSGVLADGSLRCIWANPAADTTSLGTEIRYLSREPALEMLNELADEEDFLCYAPDGGVRCEKTWQNEEYPVTDGRTLFWRDGVLIDTQYSNLAPSGYTASIVENIFPAYVPEPEPDDENSDPTDSEAEDSDPDN